MKPPKPVRLEHRGQVLTPTQQEDASAALEPYFREVGHVCTQWSLLEQKVADAIWTLAEVEHEKGACITAQIQSLDARFRALVALVKLHGGSQARIDQLNKLTAEVMKLGATRNRLVHDPLLYNVDIGAVITSRVSANRTLVSNLELVSLEALKKTGSDIIRLAKSFVTIRDKIFSELGLRYP